MRSSVAPASKMDTFFLGHGSPLVSIDDEFPVRHFYKSWQTESLRDKPKAILLISAHWETTDPCVNSVNRNSTIHDFDGWPEPLYQIQYPAPGAPELAARVKELLKKSGFKNVGEDEERGLDHGAWVPLMLMYPEADVPVCQLSVQSHLDGTHHYNVGRALQPLRDEGVLILGSGAATHNLDVVGHIGVGGPVLPWALDFDTWLRECLVNGRHEDINHYEEKAPHAKLAHPEPEHFYPLHVVLGAGGEKAKAELIHNSWEDATLSYSCYRFSTTK